MLVVAGKPRGYGVASAQIQVFLSQKPSAESGVCVLRYINGVASPEQIPRRGIYCAGPQLV